LTESVSLFFL